MVGKGNKTNQRDTLRACSGVGMLLSVSFSSPSPPLLSLSLPHAPLNNVASTTRDYRQALCNSSSPTPPEDRQWVKTHNRNRTVQWEGNEENPIQSGGKTEERKAKRGNKNRFRVLSLRHPWDTFALYTLSPLLRGWKIDRSGW